MDSIKQCMEKAKEHVSSFDSIAQEFSDTRKNSWKEFDLFLPFLASKRFLVDLGCGNGRLVPFLRSNTVAADYIGIDISPTLIKECKQTYPKEKFIETSMAYLPLKSSSADIIIASASLHHLKTKDQRERTIREVARVLKKDGVFIGLVWNMHQPRFWRLWLEFDNGWRNIIVPWHSRDGKTTNRYYYAFNKRILQKLLAPSFDEISIEYVSGTKKSSLFGGRNIFFSCKKTKEHPVL